MGLVISDGPGNGKYWRGEAYPSPPPSKSICDRKDQEEPVIQIVEANRSQQGHSKIGKTPDDDGNSSALSARGGWVDLRWNKPDLAQPANTKHACGDEKKDATHDRNWHDRYSQLIVILGKATKQCEGQEAYSDTKRSTHHENAPTDTVDE